MQVIGIGLLAFVIWFGFNGSNADRAISAFDPHALVMVFCGSIAAVLISSSIRTAGRTFLSLRELLPALRRYGPASAALEAEWSQLTDLWREGKRASALGIAERSRFPAIRKMAEMLVHRSGEASSSKLFLELRHEEIERWQPAVANWEMLSKLGPAFGMVGTITGMIQLFKNMTSDNLNIGAAMSMALLATLYGVAFGAGVAGPIATYLNNLLDARLGVLERCEKGVNELVSRVGG